MKTWMAILLGAALWLQQGIWAIGQYTVVILDQDTVERTCLRYGAPIEPGKVIVGCYVRPEKTIYTINDASVLSHEMKHAFEPAWTHD